MKFHDAIEEVRRRVNIVDIVSQYVRLSRTGNNYMGLCPFHNEKTPSFSVSESKQIFKCFGCQKAGNVYTFLQEQEGMTFPEAVKYLASKVNVTIEDDFNYNAEDKKKKDALYKLYKDVANEYYRTLYSPDGKIGLEYFIKRKLTKETIKKFGLGYAPKSFGYMYKKMKALGYEDKLLSESKLFVYKNDSVFDFFYERMMFPLVDSYNNVISFQGRILNDGDQKYINTADCIIYKKSRHLFAMNFAKFTKKDYIILCEGNMDAITLHQAGFDNAVASWGTAFTLEQANLIKRKVGKVYLCQDSDAAGIKAIKAAADVCDNVGLETYVIDTSPAKDPDEFINKFGKAEFEKRLENPKNSFLFIISSYNKQYNKENAYEYKKYIEAIVMKLCTIEDNLVREKYIKDVARQENLSIDDLEKSVKSFLKLNTKIDISNIKKDIKNADEEKDSNEVEKLFINILINNLNLLDKIINIVTPDILKDDECKIIYELLLKGYDAAKIDDYIKSLDEKTEEKIKKILFCDDSKIDTEKSESILVMNEAIRKILIKDLEQNMPEKSDPMYFDKVCEINNKKNSILDKKYL